MSRYKFNHYILALFFLLALYAIISRIWVTEDAYIIFKHIQNFYAGNGLVFNKGERVEGFTCITWTLILLAMNYFKIPLHEGSIVVGVILSISGLLILSWKIRSKQIGLTVLILPTILIVNNGFRDFSTSGLEFSLTFFILSIFYSININRKISKPFVSFLLLSLLYHTRPEFGLFLVYYGLVYLYENRLNFTSSAISASIPVLSIGVGYHIFRWVYYNDLFPNTYYAKSGGGSAWSFGGFYLLHTLRYSHLMIPLLAIFTYIFFKRRIFGLEENRYFYRESLPLLFLIVYFVKVGGDFMSFRLLLPSIAIFGILAHYYINEWMSTYKSKTYIIINFLLLNLSLFYIVFYPTTPLIKRTVVNERTVYTEGIYPNFDSLFSEINYHWFKKGESIRTFQTCLDYEPFLITNSISNAKCNKEGLGLGYYAYAAGSKVSIIDELGLTDKYVAKRPRIEKYRPGHERDVELDYLIRRGVLFCSLDDDKYDALMQTKFGIIINLNPKFLFKIDRNHYPKLISGLKSLYKTSKSANSALYAKLKLIENTQGISILNLPDFIPAVNRDFGNCWY